MAHLINRVWLEIRKIGYPYYCLPGFSRLISSQFQLTSTLWLASPADVLRGSSRIHSCPGEDALVGSPCFSVFSSLRSVLFSSGLSLTNLPGCFVTDISCVVFSTESSESITFFCLV